MRRFTVAIALLLTACGGGEDAQKSVAKAPATADTSDNKELDKAPVKADKAVENATDKVDEHVTENLAKEPPPPDPSADKPQEAGTFDFDENSPDVQAYADCSWKCVEAVDEELDEAASDAWIDACEEKECDSKWPEVAAWYDEEEKKENK